MTDQPRLAVESIAGQRPYQEDAVLAETLDDGRVLIAVADGMGGHAAGEIASATALEALVEALREGRPLAEAFTIANARVHEKAKEPGKQGMGTTLVAALVEGDQVRLANVGDSRAYRLSASGIERLTEDHSFVAEAVKRGQSEREAMAGPWKDALTRSIGTEVEVEVDEYGPMPIDDGGALLLCSDGLYKTLRDEDLLTLYTRSGSPRGAAQTLVSTALERGSDDNISVAIAEFGEVSRAVAAGTMPLAALPSREELEELEREKAEIRELELEREELEMSTAESGLGYATERKPALPPGAIAAALLAVGALLAFLVFRG